MTPSPEFICCWIHYQCVYFHCLICQLNYNHHYCFEKAKNWAPQIKRGKRTWQKGYWEKEKGKGRKEKIDFLFIRPFKWAESQKKMLFNILFLSLLFYLNKYWNFNFDYSFCLIENSMGFSRFCIGILHALTYSCENVWII